MREYSKTHPWLTFELNLERATSPKLWLLLGEIKSKCEHVAGIPLRPSVADDLHKLFLAKGVAATAAIEGNTLSEEQVLEKIEGRLTVPPSQEYLKQEITNVLSACKLITRSANRGQLQKLSPEIISFHNRLVLRDLPLDEGVVPGEITHAVRVGGYKGAPREDCELLLARLCGWLTGQELEHPDVPPMAIGILKALLAHLYLAWIHPFGDGNGRTARLLEFRLLLEAGVPSPAAHLLSNHYNQTRMEYYRQLAYTSHSKGDVVPFLLYALTGFLDGLKDQLKVIRDQQFDLTWRSLIFTAFKDKLGKNDLRQRSLIWELSKLNTSVPVDSLTLLSPVLARDYAKLSERTLWRDLDQLVQYGLLAYSRDRQFVRAKKEIIHAFLPSKRFDGADWQIQS